jgi:Ni,Fe-hydrogenase I small subunit
MGGAAAAMAVPTAFLDGCKRALQQAGARTPVIWLQAQSCSGCSVSLLNAVDPDIASVITQTISLNYHQTVMGGTGWLKISGVPFHELGMREDLGITPAPELTKGALSVVPVVASMWPVLLTGVYAISQRRDKIAREEKAAAVAEAVAKAQAEAKAKLTEAMAKAEKDKKAAIDKEVKKALDEAAKAKAQESAAAPAAATEKKPS